MVVSKSIIFSQIETLSTFLLCFTIGVGYFNILHSSSPANFDLQMAGVNFLAYFLLSLVFSRVTMPKMNPLVSISGLLFGQITPQLAVSQLISQLKGAVFASLLMFLIGTVTHHTQDNGEIALKRLLEPFPDSKHQYAAPVTGPLVGAGLFVYASFIVGARHRGNRLRGSLAVAGLSLSVALGLGNCAMAGANPLVYLPLVLATGGLGWQALLRLVIAPVVGAGIAGFLLTGFARESLEDETVDTRLSAEGLAGNPQKHDL